MLPERLFRLTLHATTVLDVHEEALRIKENKKSPTSPTTADAPTASTGVPSTSEPEKPAQTTVA